MASHIILAILPSNDLILLSDNRRIPLRFLADPPALVTGTLVRVSGRWDKDGTLVVTSIEAVRAPRSTRIMAAANKSGIAGTGTTSSERPIDRIRRTRSHFTAVEFPFCVTRLASRRPVVGGRRPISPPADSSGGGQETG